MKTNWVLMPVRNCFEYTKASIASLQQQTLPVSILVIDQHSTDGTALWLERQRSKKLWSAHFLPPHRALSDAWNWGLSLLFKETDRVLVVNNDTEFRPDTYERLLEHQMEGDRHFVTAVSVRTLEQMEKGEVEPERRGERPHPDFSCFMIDKFCYQRTGPFDRHFRPAFMEDQDYHWRMKLKNIEAVCIDIPFLHHASQTVRQNPKDARKVAKWHQFRQDYYLEKWGALWPNEIYTRPFDGKRHECKICRS